MDMLTNYKAADAARPSDEAVSLAPFRICDHVTFSDVHGDMHKGLVKWIGTDMLLMSDGTTIVGIEAVSCLVQCACIFL